MNTQENKWVIIKSILLLCVGVFGGGEIETLNDPPPFWVFIIVFIVFAGLLPYYLKAFATTTEYITKPVWQANPLRPFGDPLPFYHLCAWAGVITGIRDMLEGLFLSGIHDFSIALLSFAAGSGCFVALLMVKRF